MLKQIFFFLTFLCVFSFLYFSLGFFSRIDEKSKSLSLKFHVLKNHSEFFIWKKTNTSHGFLSPEVSLEETRRNESCPDDPPNLIGPFNVNFSSNLTLELVEKVVGSDLQAGGRYKPANCISQQKVAIVIPFRNRHEHLKHWLYYLHPILKRQQLDYGVYVINQDGDGVFNKGKLMNAGFIEALKEYNYTCFIFSDVDLIPMDDRNIYKCFGNPRHLSVAVDKFGFKLPYATIFGGVISLSTDQFRAANGFSNTFWGWGGEDDDFYNRLIHRGMKISRPDFSTGKYKMIKHSRDVHNEANPEHARKIFQTVQTMDNDGLNTHDYRVTEYVKNKLCSFITVDIFTQKNKMAS